MWGGGEPHCHRGGRGPPATLCGRSSWQSGWDPGLGHSEKGNYLMTFRSVATACGLRVSWHLPAQPRFGYLTENVHSQQSLQSRRERKVTGSRTVSLLEKHPQGWCGVVSSRLPSCPGLPQGSNQNHSPPPWLILPQCHGDLAILPASPWPGCTRRPRGHSLTPVSPGPLRGCAPALRPSGAGDEGHPILPGSFVHSLTSDPTKHWGVWVGAACVRPD